MFVPEPSIDDVHAFNGDLLDRHVVKAEEIHYKKLLPIKELYCRDEQALIALPAKPFDACRWEYVKSAGAWANSDIGELVPPVLKDVMDAQPRDELRETLRTLHVLLSYPL